MGQSTSKDPYSLYQPIPERLRLNKCVVSRTTSGDPQDGTNKETLLTITAPSATSGASQALSSSPPPEPSPPLDFRPSERHEHEPITFVADPDLAGGGRKGIVNGRQLLLSLPKGENDLFLEFEIAIGGGSDEATGSGFRSSTGGGPRKGNRRVSGSGSGTGSGFAAPNGSASRPTTMAGTGSATSGPSESIRSSTSQAPIQGLSFACSSSPQALARLLEQGTNRNPNLQNSPHFTLVPIPSPPLTTTVNTPDGTSRSSSRFRSSAPPSSTPISDSMPATSTSGPGSSFLSASLSAAGYEQGNSRAPSPSASSVSNTEPTPDPSSKPESAQTTSEPPSSTPPAPLPKSSVPTPISTQLSSLQSQAFTFSWPFRAPPGSDRTKGYHLHCAFVEYIPSSNSFNLLSSFSLWVEKWGFRPTTPQVIANFGYSAGGGAGDGYVNATTVPTTTGMAKKEKSHSLSTAGSPSMEFSMGASMGFTGHRGKRKSTMSDDDAASVRASYGYPLHGPYHQPGSVTLGLAPSGPTQKNASSTNHTSSGLPPGAAPAAASGGGLNSPPEYPSSPLSIPRASPGPSPFQADLLPFPATTNTSSSGTASSTPLTHSANPGHSAVDSSSNPPGSIGGSGQNFHSLLGSGVGEPTISEDRPLSPSQAPHPLPPVPDQGELDDSPLFRATLSSLEKRVAGLRRSVKSIFRASESLHAHWSTLDEVETKLDDSFKELSESNPSSIKPLEQTYLEHSRRTLAWFRKETVNGVETKLVDQMRKLNSVLKAADGRKKAFDAESKAYYDHVSKYLALRSDPQGDEASKTKEQKADAKYQGKKDRFTLARLEYRNYLHELAVFKEIELLFLFTSWSQYSHDVFTRAAKDLWALTEQLNRLESDVEEARQDIDTQRITIEEGRRSLETRLAMGRPEQARLQQEASLALGPSLTRTISEVNSGPASGPESVAPSAIGASPTLSPAHKEGKISNLPDPELATSTATSTSTTPSVPARSIDRFRERVKTSLNGLVLPSNKTDSTTGMLGLPSSQAGTSSGSKKGGGTGAATAPPTPSTTTSGSLQQQQAPSGGHTEDQVKFKGFRDLEPVDAERAASTVRKKEGFLWATSRPLTHQGSGEAGTRGWHKFWCVLSNGLLTEYSGWRDSLELHGQPINLRFATVRESRNLDRRFCFEVITPQIKRVYQATSEQEIKDWTRSIMNCIESLLNGTSSVRNFDPARIQATSNADQNPGLGISSVSSPESQSGQSSNSFGQVLEQISRPAGRRSSMTKNANKRQSLGVKAPSTTQAEPAPPLSRRPYHLSALSEGSKSMTSFFSSEAAKVAHRLKTAPSPGNEPVVTGPSPLGRRGSDASSIEDFDRRIEAAVHSMAGPLSEESTTLSEEDKDRNSELLTNLQQSQGNNICADCGRDDPRWASWNLGVFICIRCSGVHRSLGTHISKVRSVDLDQWSDDQLSCMVAGGNEVANALWEAQLDPKEKPGTNSPADVVLEFIKAKYSEKRWMLRESEGDDQGEAEAEGKFMDVPEALRRLST